MKINYIQSLFCQRNLFSLMLGFFSLILISCGGGGSGGSVETPVATVPDAPSSLSAVATSESSIDLNWTDHSDSETNYVIQRSMGSGSGFTTIATLEVNITSYSDTSGLSASTTYYYQVYATNNVGSSANSNEAFATTAALAVVTPNAPSDLSAVAASESGIDLSWADNSTNETNFVVQRSMSPSTGFTMIATLGVNNTSYADTGLIAGTTYYYRMYATNSIGNSTNSNEANATTDTSVAPVPNAPTGLSAVAVSEANIALSWSDNSIDETNFVLQRSLSSGTGFVTIVTLNADATSYTDSGLTASTTYYYRVYATNNAANSANSNEVSATTDAPAITIPNAPSGLSAVTVSESSISLSWSDNSLNESNFVLQRSLSSGAGFVTIATLSANVKDYADNGLSASTTYYYRVYAKNSAGNSANSNETSATTDAPAIAVPNAPSNLSAVATSEANISLSWISTSTVESSTIVQRSVSSGTGFATIASLTGVISYTDSGLTASTTYYYRVYETNSAGDSANSNEAFATTDAPAATTPNAPSGLSSTAVYITTALFGWTDNSTDETGFIIERSTSSSTGSFSQVATLPAGTNSYSDTSLNAGTSYYFRIVAYNGGGNSYSNVKTITTADLAPTLTIPSSADSDVSFSVSWTYGWGSGALFGSSQDGFELQRSSSSAISGFSTIYSTVGTSDRSSSKTITDNLSAGTYYYRVRARLNTVLSNWSGVKTVIVSSSAQTLRIINDLADYSVGTADWGLWNKIIRVRIGPSATAVINDSTNTYEQLTPYDSISSASYSSGLAEVILPDSTLPQKTSSVWEMDVSSYGSSYSVYIQNGWWEYVCIGSFCSWEKHMTVVTGCDGSTLVYKWAAINVTLHSSGVQEIKASNFLPQGSWGAPFCG